ncbi:MAG: DUF2835 family protein [Pseudomonadales bacterium]
MSTIRIYLNIPKQTLLQYYKGSARSVLTTASDGRRIRFPIACLRPFVRSDGIRGSFELEIDADNRLHNIRPLGQSAIR